jgi:hydroxypyruvate reductase
MPDPAELLRSLVPRIRARADVREATRRAMLDPARCDVLAGPVHLLAIGKASLEMTQEALELLGARVVRGLVTAVPERTGGVRLPERIEVRPADHPLPSGRNVAAAGRVLEFVQSVPASGTLLVLISGGGSAHLALPAEGVALEDLRAVTLALQRSGATINELNAVRKHCELLKGGRLAAASTAGRVEVLIVSDVIGDAMDVISSGPFSPDDSTFAEALRVLETRSSTGVSDAVTALVRRGAAGRLPETPKRGDRCFDRVRSAVIANNVGIARFVGDTLRETCDHVIVRWGVTGDAATLGSDLARMLSELHAHLGGPSAVVVAGEWTVDVGGASGVGGPSQELALAAAIGLDAVPGAAVLAYSTDGVDGPTDAAGAMVDSRTAARMRELGIDPARALADHDSHAALDAVGPVIRTGPTGTNVNHIAVGVVV